MAVANAISATSNTIGTRVLKGVPSFLSSLTSRVEPNPFLFFGFPSFLWIMVHAVAIVRTAIVCNDGLFAMAIPLV